MTRIAIVAVLLATVPSIAAAQQPDHVAVHGLVALSPEADPHQGGAVSWQKHVGRNWSLNVEYDFSTTALTASDQKEHSDHVLWLGVTKTFGPRPLDGSLPYIVIGGAGAYRHTLYERDNRDNLAGGFSLTPGIGIGLRDWNKSRTWFIAPEAQAVHQRVLHGVGGVRVSSLTLAAGVLRPAMPDMLGPGRADSRRAAGPPRPVFCRPRGAENLGVRFQIATLPTDQRRTDSHRSSRTSW